MREILARSGFAAHGDLREQLEKSSERPCPNIAEGFARYLPADNARFVRIAAGSHSETIEHLDRAHAKKLITAQELTDLQTLARRARGAATGLIRYLQSADAPHLPPRRHRRRRRTKKQPPAADAK
jgi:four helix bundle protein